MGRSRTGQRSRGRRSIEVPTDLNPILTREGVDGSRTNQLQTRVNNLQNQVSSLQSQVASLKGDKSSLAQTVTQLRSKLEQARTQLEASYSQEDVQKIAQDYFNLGVQRLIEYLRNQGIL
jgi:chromosome segregation ATPase